jgi:hypothetical protein
MKQIFTLLFAIIYVNTSLIAQSSKKTSVRLNSHRNFIAGLMQQQVNHAAGMRAITSGPSERVIAQCTRDSVHGAKTDSVSLKYVLNGTSVYDFNMMLYAYNYPYSASPMFNYLGTHTSPQVLFDSYYHWTIDPNTNVYGFYQKDFTSYDVNKNMIKDTSVFADSTIIPNMVYANRFNAANTIDTGYWFNWKLGVADSAFKQYFKYNASNKLTKDSTYEYHGGSWHLVSKTFYTYDVANNLIQIDNYSNNSDTTFTLPLIEQLKYVNTYDVSNRMLTTLTSYYNGTALTLFVKDTFAYTGAYSFHTSWKEYQYDAINSYWAPMTYMTKHLNLAGFPDTVNIESFDSLSNAWVPATRDLIKYDGFNNPDTLYDYEYNFTSFPVIPNFTTVYYYAPFVNTTSVNDIAVKNTNVIVFPNPAHKAITVSGIETKKAIVLITLIDAEGRIYNRQQLPLQNGTFQLSVDDVTPGIYWIVVQDDAGNMLHRQSIVKE